MAKWTVMHESARTDDGSNCAAVGIDLPGYMVERFVPAIANPGVLYEHCQKLGDAGLLETLMQCSKDDFDRLILGAEDNHPSTQTISTVSFHLHHHPSAGTKPSWIASFHYGCFTATL
jgi:hypothetical protein